jgi:hypothetical protein
MKKDAYYFPHYCNARHDRKIKRLQKDLGVEGYGIFFMILEVLREQTDFKFPLSDLDLLAIEFNVSLAKIEATVKSYDLFEIDINSNFFSPKLLLYLQPYLEKSNRARVAANKRWEEIKLIEGECKSNANAYANAEQMQSKCNANQNASKVNKVNKENIYNELFESLWTLYPNKKGKGQVGDTQKKKLHDIGFDELSRCIERYKKSKENWKEWQQGSTFFNSGYVDYLDKNVEVEVPRKKIEIVVKERQC